MTPRWQASPSVRIIHGHGTGALAPRPRRILVRASAGRTDSCRSRGSRRHGDHRGRIEIVRRDARQCSQVRFFEAMAEAGSFAERVKQQADIVRVIGEYVRLKKTGQNFTGLCPFHQEKTPSFAVHPVKQIYHCFGCGAGGDVFKFVMEVDKCDVSRGGAHRRRKVRHSDSEAARAFARGAARESAARRARRDAPRSGGVFRAAAPRRPRKARSPRRISKIAASIARP